MESHEAAEVAMAAPSLLRAIGSKAPGAAEATPLMMSSCCALGM